MTTDTKYTLSASLKMGGLSEKKAMMAIFHNERLGWVRSEINKESGAWKYVNGEMRGIKKDPDSREKRRENSYERFRKDIGKLHKHNEKKIEKDPENFDVKNNRNRKYSQFKHNVVSEIIIHVGKGGSKLLRKGGTMKQALLNLKKWQKEVGLHEHFFSCVLHGDEKGESHIHILIPASDSKTGKKRRMLKPDMKKLQDMIWQDCEGFKRGADWDLEPEKRTVKRTPQEYEDEQERLKAAEAKVLKMEIENNRLEQQNFDLEAKARQMLADQEKLEDVLDGDMGNYIVDIVLERIEHSEKMVKDKNGDMSFVEKLHKIKQFIVDWKEIERRDAKAKAKLIKQLNQLDRIDKAIIRSKPKGPSM